MFVSAENCKNLSLAYETKAKIFDKRRSNFIQFASQSLRFVSNLPTFESLNLINVDKMNLKTKKNIAKNQLS